MISRKGSFLSAHWDWLVLAVAALALAGAGAFYFLGGGEIDAEASDLAAQARRAKANKKAAEPIDLKTYTEGVFAMPKPVSDALASSPVRGGFLASERRVYCSNVGCSAAIPSGLTKCPVCGAELEKKAVEEVVRDKDNDGIDDDWEKKYGLDPKDPADGAADPDGDLFTNLEEFQAKTDPKDPKAHPDYLGFVTVKLPLKETVLPFYLQGVTPVRDGVVRFRFFDPKKKNDYGQRGTTYSVLSGEEIGKTGFIAKSFEKKTARRKLKGGTGMVGEVDVSEATLERKSDRKLVKLVLDERKPVAVDVQATLVFNRGPGTEYTVVPGDTIQVGDPKCGGQKCKVTKIERLAKGAEVTLRFGIPEREQKVRALEP